ncbi:DUF1697 domain-containing protein [Paenibacillus sp. KN14-4R]|uniref:DUF1697 domain-containing protein n=1 Tax=Paenibacillus sp. KN14-4R TaxID=3445773 RepID=UPI003F9F3619
MTIYCALLRGINVSGHNMIKMAELKKMFEEMGYGRVQTYINSGNILFESEEDELTIQERLEQGIKEVFGFQIAVILRTAEEIERILAKCPFVFEELVDKQSIHLTMLRDALTQADYDKMPEVDQGLDQYLIDGREIYVFYHNSILDSKLTKKFQKLVPQTARNWKTMMKLHSLAQAMKA